jgi:hypothetical protein
MWLTWKDAIATVFVAAGRGNAGQRAPAHILAWTEKRAAS